MITSRRGFLQLATTVAGASTLPATARAWESRAPDNPFACLVDLTRCIGCRKCEEACNRANDLPGPAQSFEDLRVLENERRPNTTAYTVINRYTTGSLGAGHRQQPTYVKVQCMHCQDPACASACPTGAMAKQANGAVTYDPSQCIGCRYCLIACPFQIPAYEYERALAPRVRKCTFCFERLEVGKLPACAAVCPADAIVFGRRRELLAEAKRRIRARPARYVSHVYGEHEVGGTSWLYLSGIPFPHLAFPDLPSQALPRPTESIQHALFHNLWSPAALFALLAAVMAVTRRSDDERSGTKGDEL